MFHTSPATQTRCHGNVVAVGDRRGSVEDNVGESYLVWRFATEGSPHFGLRSNFAKLDINEQSSLLQWVESAAKSMGRTTDEQYKAVTTLRHAFGDTKESPWISTGGHLAPIIRTTDEGGSTRLFEQTVIQAESLFLLRVPASKLNFDAMATTSEVEILADAMFDPLDSYVVGKLPNVFQDEQFARSLRPGIHKP